MKISGATVKLSRRPGIPWLFCQESTDNSYIGSILDCERELAPNGIAIGRCSRNVKDVRARRRTPASSGITSTAIGKYKGYREEQTGGGNPFFLFPAETNDEYAGKRKPTQRQPKAVGPVRTFLKTRRV